MPQATFRDGLLHPSLHEQAAAYLFHIGKTHPFIDGTKRVGLASPLTFLRLNDDPVDLVLGVASGDRSKADVAVFLRERTVS